MMTCPAGARCSISSAIDTVSPNRVIALGIFLPTTPAITKPLCMPMRTTMGWWSGVRKRRVTRRMANPHSTSSLVWSACSSTTPLQGQVCVTYGLYLVDVILVGHGVERAEEDVQYGHDVLRAAACGQCSELYHVAEQHVRHQPLVCNEGRVSESE